MRQEQQIVRSRPLGKDGALRTSWVCSYRASVATPTGEVGYYTLCILAVEGKR